jgi:hypothetical protein
VDIDTPSPLAARVAALRVVTGMMGDGLLTEMEGGGEKFFLFTVRRLYFWRLTDTAA